MIRLNLKKLFYLASAPIILLIFLTDVFFYYSNITIVAIPPVRELLIILGIVLFYAVVRASIKLDTLTLKQKLLRFSYLLFANYLVYLFLKLLLSPQYSPDFPPRYLSLGAIGFSTVIALVAIATLIPILFILRDLIFYKQRRFTAPFYNLFLLLTLLTSLSVAISRQPLDFQFSKATFLNDLLFSTTLLVAFVLSFRSDWITYLPRKEKMIYCFLGIFVVGAVANLFDTVYKQHLAPFSLFVATLANVFWLFMLFYSIIAFFKLCLHLPTAKAFDRKLKEVNSLYDMARLLNNELKFERLTQLITQLTAKVLEGDSTWLEMYDDKSDRLTVVSHINLSAEELASNPFVRMDNPINQQIFQSREVLLINDVHQSPPYRETLAWKKNARSLVAAPLFSNRGQLMGILYSTRGMAYSFDVDDASLMEGFANQAAIALENANLLQQSIERERLEQELKIAREVQLKLLPQEIPVIEGFSLDAFSITAYEVGGDYYDFFMFADNQPGVVIGDVSGKGTSAAFYMAEFKGVIQTLAKTLTDPKELLCKANRIFYSNIDRRSFVSAIVGKFNPQKREFEFARAGHTPIVYCANHRDVPLQLQPPGIGIGLDSGSLFDSIIVKEKIVLSEGDTFLLYTDGLTEARNPNAQEFGEERLCALIMNCQNLSAIELKEKIMDSVMDFIGNTPLHDDLTLIVVKYISQKS